MGRSLLKDLLQDFSRLKASSKAQQTSSGSSEGSMRPLRFNSTALPPYSAYKETCSGESETASWMVPFGIALGSFGSVGINLGNNLQSLGLTTQAAELAAHLEQLERDGWEIDMPGVKLPPPPFMTRGRVLFIVGSFTFFVAS